MSAPATASRRSPKGDRRRKELVGIACTLFATRGFDKTSLQDIADAAGLTKAAVYHHFPDKARLYEAVVVSSLAAIHAASAAETDLADTPLEKLRAFVRASARLIDEDRMNWVVGSNLFWSLDETERSPAILAARDRQERFLRELIRDAIDAGELRAVEPEMLGRLILSALNQIPRWHRPEGRLSAQDVAGRYMDMILDGVRADV